jgi:hypothetical protein
MIWAHAQICRTWNSIARNESRLWADLSMVDFDVPGGSRTLSFNMKQLVKIVARAPLATVTSVFCHGNASDTKAVLNVRHDARFSPWHRSQHAVQAIAAGQHRLERLTLYKDAAKKSVFAHMLKTIHLSALMEIHIDDTSISKGHSEAADIIPVLRMCPLEKLNLTRSITQAQLALLAQPARAINCLRDLTLGALAAILSCPAAEVSSVMAGQSALPTDALALSHLGTLGALFPHLQRLTVDWLRLSPGLQAQQPVPSTFAAYASLHEVDLVIRPFAVDLVKHPTMWHTHVQCTNANNAARLNPAQALVRMLKACPVLRVRTTTSMGSSAVLMPDRPAASRLSASAAPTVSPALPVGTTPIVRSRRVTHE